MIQSAMKSQHSTLSQTAELVVQHLDWCQWLTVGLSQGRTQSRAILVRRALPEYRGLLPLR